MAANLLIILQSIRQKTGELSVRCRTLAREVGEKDKVIADLRAEISELKSQLEALKADNEYLAVSHRLASSPDEIVRSRRLISGWIRDIDRCIAQLKE